MRDGVPGQEEWAGDEDVRLTLAELAGRTQQSLLPIPLQNPTLLPLAALDPEVLERLVAEMVSRQYNHGVQFYGRRGQTQYGLDIVERERGSRRSLYQVKRFQVFSGGQLRAAVEEYAAAPRPRGYIGLARRFDPYRFVVVTSAELDSDTSNVDTLTALQDDYAGDLEIEAWGAEALSRSLRFEPNLVYAMFGAAWAKAWCGFEPAPRAPTAPASLGLVEAPVRVLNLVALEADAKSAEDTDPRRACHLYGVLAQSLDDGHFPGHAASMRRRRASAAKAANEPETAFAILFQLVLERVVGGDTDSGRGDRELEELASAIGGVPEAKWSVLARVAAWYERGSDLSVLIPALQKIVAARDPDAALLCCLVVEQALVDGLYDLTPPRSLMVEADEHTPQLLDDLSALTADTDSSDVVLRARLACAAADTLLTVDASSGQVQAAYGQILQSAAAGRYGRARGMVISRGAYALFTSTEVVYGACVTFCLVRSLVGVSP